MMTDPIADLLTRIRNAALARLDRTELPYSKLKESVVDILKAEGYVTDFRVNETNKTLTGDDIKAVVDGTRGPLVDGSEYHTREFAEEAKVYHQRVLIAHREHAAVDAQLPTVNGQVGSKGDLAAKDLPRPPRTGDGRTKRTPKRKPRSRDR